jgi:hypothetical protein
MHKAVIGNDLPRLQALYEAHGPSIIESVDGRFNSTPLCIASLSGGLPALAWLIERGAQLNVRFIDGFGPTPIFAACQKNRTEGFFLLLQAGADVHLRYDFVLGNFSSVTLLMIIARKGSLEMLTMLLQRVRREGEEKERKKNNDPNQLYQESHPCSSSSTSLHLLNYVRACDDKGKTVLHYAVENGHVSLVWPLLLAGSDATQRDMQGRTPLDVCHDDYPGCAHLLQVALLELERILIIHKLRLLTDTAHSIEQFVNHETNVKILTVALPSSMQGRMCMYLTPRVELKEKRTSIRRMAMASAAGKIQAEGNLFACTHTHTHAVKKNQDEEKDDTHKKRQAVLAHVVLNGGLEKDLFIELLEYLTPPWGLPSPVSEVPPAWTPSSFPH